MIEPFEPGLAYGNTYQYFVWVCTNPVDRRFEKCNIPEGEAVLNAFRRGLQEKGLGREVLVSSSGCMLGCKDQGTAVAIISPDAHQQRVLFLQNVTVQDVPDIIQTYLLRSRSSE
jgi:predicted metal-binding protein